MTQIMGRSLIGRQNMPEVCLIPQKVSDLSRIIEESANNIKAEYENLEELEDALHGKIGGDLSKDFQNVKEDIEQHIGTTRETLLEISQIVGEYAGTLEKANEEAATKAAGGGVYYELPMQ